jgi:hypothetical protein
LLLLVAVVVEEEDEDENEEAVLAAGVEPLLREIPTNGFNSPRSAPVGIKRIRPAVD